MTQHQAFFIGMVLLITGAIIRLTVGKNRFNRRNRYGLQCFETYEEKTVTQAGEGCAGVIGTILAFIGILFILAGLA